MASASFLTRESRMRLANDISALRNTLPRPTPPATAENVDRILSSTERLSDAHRGRLLATHLQLIDENRRLRSMVAATNIGVERIIAKLRDGNASRKRSHPVAPDRNTSKRRRM